MRYVGAPQHVSCQQLRFMLTLDDVTFGVASTCLFVAVAAPTSRAPLALASLPQDYPPPSKKKPVLVRAQVLRSLRETF